MDAIKSFFRAQASGLHDELWNIACKIGENPELGYQEFLAAELLCRFLKEHGFEVQPGIGGLETAFLARFTRSKPGPKLVFLAEYDALPEVGHGCGHNLIGTASAGAAAVLSKSLILPGEVWVIGTPAEETSGAKVLLVEKGYFKEVDAALMFHPGSQNVPHISTLALDAWEFTFMGKSAHSVAAVCYGINALDVLIEFFGEVGKLKEAFGDDYKINGIITEGGTTPNVIPDRAVARFYLRATKRPLLNKLTGRVIDCAKAVAEKKGARVKCAPFESSYDEMCSNQVLANAFAKNLESLGEKNICHQHMVLGSVDMGNVSRVVPAIHPYLKLGSGMDIPHTQGFAHSTMSEAGEEVLRLAVQALSFTGWDVLTDEKLLAKIRLEFRSLLK